MINRNNASILRLLAEIVNVEAKVQVNYQAMGKDI